jgi:hypothetical protein
MSLWRTADGQDWVLIPLSEQERVRVEHVRETMQRALATCLDEGVALGVRTGKLLVYPHAPALPDHRLASAAVLRAQAQLAGYYGLADLGDRRALAAVLADDFAARYQDALVREQASDAAPEPGAASPQTPDEDAPQ